MSWVMENAGGVSTLLTITATGAPVEVVGQNYNGASIAYGGSPVCFVDGVTRETAILVSLWANEDGRATPITFSAGEPAVGVPQAISSGFAGVINGEEAGALSISPVPGVSGNAIVMAPRHDGGVWKPLFKEITLAGAIVTDRAPTVIDGTLSPSTVYNLRVWPHDPADAQYFGVGSFHYNGYQNYGLIERTALNTFVRIGNAFYSGLPAFDYQKSSPIPSQVPGHFVWSYYVSGGAAVYFAIGYLDPTVTLTHPYVTAGNAGSFNAGSGVPLGRRNIEEIEPGVFASFWAGNDRFDIVDGAPDFSSITRLNYGVQVGPPASTGLSKIVSTVENADGTTTFKTVHLNKGTDEIQYRTASITVDPTVADGNLRSEVSDWTTLEAVAGGGEPIDLLIPGDGSDKILTALYTGPAHSSVRMATLTHAG